MSNETEPREPITHDLKVWPKHWDDLLCGRKTFELRMDKRPGIFRVGDTLRLFLYDPHHGGTSSKYRTYIWNQTVPIVAKITYILRGDDVVFSDEFVILALGDRTVPS